MAGEDFKLDYYRDAITGRLHRRLDFVEELLNVQNGNNDKTRTFVGFEDFLSSGLAFTGQGPNSPTLKVFRDNVKQVAFAGTGTKVEEGFFNIHLTHKLKADVDVTTHLHVGHIIGSPTGNVKWYIDYMYGRGYGGIFDTTVTDSVIYTPTAQYEHIITDDDSVTISSTLHDLEPDGIILCRVYRDPADVEDTFANDCYLFFADCHFEVGQFATQERNRPFTAEGF